MKTLNAYLVLAAAAAALGAASPASATINVGDNLQILILRARPVHGR